MQFEFPVLAFTLVDVLVIEIILGHVLRHLSSHGLDSLLRGIGLVHVVGSGVRRPPITFSLVLLVLKFKWWRYEKSIFCQFRLNTLLNF